MKLYIKSYSTIRDYNVSIFPKYVKSEALDSWSLEANSQAGAKSFGYDVLAGLSINEIFEDRKDKYKSFIDKIKASNPNLGENSPMGYDIAEKFFKVVVSKD